MMQVKIGSHEDSGSTAYKPVMKAITIAPIANMVRTKPGIICLFRNTSFSCHDIKMKMNIADTESTMARVSITTNALKAVFFARVAVPSLTL